MDVEMKIRGLVMDPASNMPIVILKDVKSDTVLPIWVGMYEPESGMLDIRFWLQDGRRVPEWEVRRPAHAGLGGEVARTGVTIAMVQVMPARCPVARLPFWAKRT